MPKVTVTHICKSGPKETFQRTKIFFESDEGLRRLDPNIKFEFDEARLTGKAKGNQFKADINITSSAQGSSIEVIVDLPLLLTPFKGKVQETIERKLSKHLA